MGHAHPIEGAVWDAIGRVQVGVEIEGDESDAILVAGVQMTGDRAEFDRAVAAEYERNLPLLDDLANAPCGRDDVLDDGVEVLRPRPFPIRSPAPDGTVAIIDDADTVTGEALDQTRGSQGARRQFLTRRIRTRARWNADDADSPVHLAPPVHVTSKMQMTVSITGNVQ
jgi:hypothetical protein